MTTKEQIVTIARFSLAVFGGAICGVLLASIKTQQELLLALGLVVVLLNSTLAAPWRER